MRSKRDVAGDYHRQAAGTSTKSRGLGTRREEGYEPRPRVVHGPIGTFELAQRGPQIRALRGSCAVIVRVDFGQIVEIAA
jgi:hypothetical protein